MSCHIRCVKIIDVHSVTAGALKIFDEYAVVSDGLKIFDVYSGTERMLNDCSAGRRQVGKVSGREAHRAGNITENRRRPIG